MTRSNLVGALFAIAGAATPFVILALRFRAKRQPAPARAITDEERRALRAAGRLSLSGFIGFWVVYLAFLLAVILHWIPPAVEPVFYAAVIALAATGIAFHLSIRCPACRYRLGYQRSLGIPARCERCGTGL